MPHKNNDLQFMRLALHYALEAAANGEIPVGAVLVNNQKVIGAGANCRLQSCSPFAHAEMIAIQAGAHKMNQWRLDGCTLYVTLEPCPMCAGAIIQTRISKVVYGAYDPKAGAGGTLYNILQDSRLSHQCSVIHGFMKKECASLLKNFFLKKRKKY